MMLRFYTVRVLSLELSLRGYYVHGALLITAANTISQHTTRHARLIDSIESFPVSSKSPEEPKVRTDVFTQRQKPGT